MIPLRTLRCGIALAIFAYTTGKNAAATPRLDYGTVSIIIQNAVTLEWDNIALIGYATFAVGPLFDDWFLVFVDKADISYWVCLCSPWPGAEQIANHVAGMNGVVLGEKGTLVNSTANDSVVVWPAERAGEPLPECQSKGTS